jgi:acetyl-CoA carboxylase biotin carboxylase subunit
MEAKKILIANRGEIALRIIRTIKKLGHVAVVFRSNRDKDAPYLEEADEIIDANESLQDKVIFLDADKIVELAKTHHIDMIHPGYGFLSENPDFARKCIEAGLIFIGPHPDHIYQMGIKTIAKEIAEKVGLPLVPGSEGVVKTVDEAKKIARKIGYPILLKAAGGGGGRGMRVVEKADQLERYFNAATQEALNAFGNGDLFIEKYIENPKHIEVQILGDQHGNVVHLWERECSLQRKHQKLLEEAPSPSLTDRKRSSLGKLAVKFAKALGYYSTGTIEFIMDEKKNLYFMEMNTRLQVEHPVTEEITGLDLVEWQIRIALGEKLPFKQKDIPLNGWAIECRINAEDPQNRFSPETGFIESIRFPYHPQLRIESGVTDGTYISTNFDSMLAKLIVHEKNRKKAIESMLKVLEETRITGIKTLVPFFKVVLSHPDFVKGTYTTHWIENVFQPEMLIRPEDEMIAALAASIAYAMEYLPIAGENIHIQQDNINFWVLNKRLR